MHQYILAASCTDEILCMALHKYFTGIPDLLFKWRRARKDLQFSCFCAWMVIGTCYLPFYHQKQVWLTILASPPSGINYAKEHIL